MSSIVYDPIMNALLAYLKNNITTGLFNTFARGMILWPQLQQQNQQQAQTQDGLRQPALFLYDGMGLGGGITKYDRQGRAQPPIRTISRTVIIYARATGPAGQPGNVTGGKGLLPTGGGTILHPLIEAVETALNTPDNPVLGTLTLGGLVAYCRIEGKGLLSSPDTDDNGQGMATLPVEIRIP